MKKKITLLLAMLLMLGTGSVWAEQIEPAGDGYYHITDKSTWSKFARTVNGTGGYTQNVGLNAVLDADITIENDGDFNAGFIVGNGSTPSGGVAAIYTGTFDGQGHTLTFTKTLNQEFLAPFGKVCGATIKNLKVAGTLTGEASNARIAVVAYVEHTAGKTTTVEYVSSAMNITTTYEKFDGTIGGIVGLVNTDANLVVQGCMYTGTVTSVKSTSGILGYSRSNNVTIKNNLAKCTFILSNTSALSNRYIYRAADESSITNENNFYQITNTKSVPVSGYGTEANEAQYNSGEMAWYLSGADNSSSSTYFWGQDLNNPSSTPMLTSDATYKVFNAGDKYTNWTNTINNDEDWVTFSKLVANGYADMNVTMTADVNAGSTMVGTSSSPYSGTFDGKGHKLTFTYSGSDQFAAPFQYVNAATFQDIIITGSITSSSNQIASLVGKNTGATTISRCVSHATINSTDSSNGRVGGFVGRSADNGNPATNTVVFNYCLYDGSITTSRSGYAAGFVAWDDGTNSITLNNCMVAATIGENAGGKNFSQAPNIPEGKFAYYLNKFGSDSNGTKLTEQLLNSGQAAWTLNYGNESDVLFFGQGNLNKSNIEAYPTLTSDATKKVVKLTPQGVSTPLYANPGGAAPNPVRYGALGFRLQGSSDNPSLVVLPNDITDATTLVRRYDQYTLSVSSAGATTLVLPFDAELPSGVTAYDISYTPGDDKVTAKPVDKITANEPVLINAAEGTYTFTVSNSSVIPYGTASYTNGALTGAYVQSDKSGDYNPIAYVPANSYVLQNGAEGPGFYKVAADNTIKITSFRAYLKADGGARSLSIDFEDDNTTAIKQMRTSMQEFDAYFNLSGQRVAQPTKGLYIVNGKKVIIK